MHMSGLKRTVLTLSKRGLLIKRMWSSCLPLASVANSQSAKDTNYATCLTAMAALIGGMGGAYYTAMDVEGGPAVCESQGTADKKGKEEVDHPAIYHKQSTRRHTHHNSVDRITSNYEDQIRYFSNAEKIFRYFATVKIGEHIYMRPQDFIRSITPGEMQPEGLGLDRYQNFGDDPNFMIGTSNSTEPLLQYNFDGSLKETNIILDFAEYKFLLTMLTAPEAHYDIAFCLVDNNHNGAVELRDFLNLTGAVAGTHKKSVTIAAGLTRDNENVLRRSHLLRHLFGDNGTKCISMNEFKDFINRLHYDVFTLDFLFHRNKEKRRAARIFGGLADSDLEQGIDLTDPDIDPDPSHVEIDSNQEEDVDLNSSQWFGLFSSKESSKVLCAGPNTEAACQKLKISPIGLSKMLLKHARLKAENRKEYYQRINHKFPPQPVTEWTITCDEARNLFEFMNYIEEFELALKMTSFLSGLPMTPTEFKRIALAASGIELSDQIADLVHTLFAFYNKENVNMFVMTMRNAKNPLGGSRDRPRGLGIFELYKCMRQQYEGNKDL